MVFTMHPDRAMTVKSNSFASISSFTSNQAKNSYFQAIIASATTITNKLFQFKSELIFQRLFRLRVMKMLADKLVSKMVSDEVNGWISLPVFRIGCRTLTNAMGDMHMRLAVHTMAIIL
jgi:hypothetical protein